MSNIYNRRLDYEVLPSGKRVLDYPTKISVPNYAVVGNTKPNLDFKTNRMLQPLFQTKKPIAQGPYTPKQPVNAVGLGGRKPYYIDYTIPKSAPRPAMGLSWEPNSVREQRDNVYPDGVPKNASSVSQQNAKYLEEQYADKEAKRLEQVIQGLSAGERRPLGGRIDHPREQQLQRLEKMLEERKYTANPYKNVALSVDDHRKMAEKSANEIRDELAALRRNAKEHRTDIVKAINESSVVSGSVEIPLGDPDEAKDPREKKKINEINDFISKFPTKGNNYDFGADPMKRVELMTAILVSNGLDDATAEITALRLLREGQITKIRSKSEWSKIASLSTLPSKIKEAKDFAASKEGKDFAKIGSKKLIEEIYGKSGGRKGSI
jgi:hypothetical protein